MPPESPTRVLLVDDDEDEFVLLRDMLAEADPDEWRLDWVADWDQALAVVERGTYDAHLIDYRLGPHDGIELLRELIALGRQPVILLTGYGGREVDLRAMEAGAADYLVKGRFDASALERTLRYAIRQKSLEDQLRRSHAELEQRVRERTAELARANQELRQEVAERRRAEEALKDADRRKDEFLAILGHELRTPLGPIRCAIEVLQEHRNSPADKVLAREIIDRQVDQLVRIVDDLMDVSAITLGKTSLQREIVPVEDAVTSAIETVRNLIEERGHRLETDLPGQPSRVHADPARLRQVFQNLLGNAAKYTEPGGTIAVSVDRQNGEALVRVRDTGLGIAPEHLPHVFEPFTQAERTLPNAGGGIGIGLTVVRRLVEMHGGTVSAASRGVGQGSEFTVRLPLAPD